MQFINLNKCTFCTGWEDLNCYLAGTYKSRIRLSSDLDFFVFDIAKNYIFEKNQLFQLLSGDMSTQHHVFKHVFRMGPKHDFREQFNPTFVLKQVWRVYSHTAFVTHSFR